MTPRRRRFLKRQHHLKGRASKALKRARKCKRQNRVGVGTLLVPKVASEQRVRNYDRKRVGVRFPSDFSLLDHPEATITFFRHLRKLILEQPHRAVAMDHSSIANLSPEAGLVLIAELYRADFYAPRCQKFGNPASAPLVGEIFQKIGYWQHFGINYNGPERSGRQFILQKTGRRTSGSLVKSVIAHLSEVAAFSPAEKQRLYEAFIECMDNVMNHAYPHRIRTPPVLIGQWWLLAYRDSTTKEVWLCFLDQGEGIPGTIRTRIKDLLPLFRPDDSALIVKAVTEGSFSKHDSPTRGNGLPTLRAFVDEAQDGELRIMSNYAYCVFAHGKKPETKMLTQSFDGTLVVWRIRR